MDLNGIASYIETTSQSLERTREFVARMQEFAEADKPQRPLVQAVITPRFVPTCSSELMRGLASIADEHGLRVQSHMCESEGQVEWSKGMWDGKSDVEVLKEVSSRTLLWFVADLPPSRLAARSSPFTLTSSSLHAFLSRRSLPPCFDRYLYRPLPSFQHLLLP